MAQSTAPAERLLQSRHKASLPLSARSATQQKVTIKKTPRPPSTRSTGRSHGHERGPNTMFLQSFWNG
eukprot:10595260-Alexandrium_andersonii.AAC.1